MTASPDAAPLAGAVRDLGREFWDWRAGQRPRSSDDIPRMDRPRGWVPDWSAAAVDSARTTLAAFEGRLRDVDVSHAAVNVQVDHRLLGSAMSRVRWELDILRSWQRDAVFYVDQSVGTVFDALLRPPPFGEERARDLVELVRAIPTTLQDARANLSAAEAVGAFAGVAARGLARIEQQFPGAMQAVAALLPGGAAQDLLAATGPAAAALAGFRDWLVSSAEAMTGEAAVGQDAFCYFLHNVALLPYTPEQLLVMGRLEWHRAVAWETVARNRHRGHRPPEWPDSVEAQVEAEDAAERQVRAFYDAEGLLSQPPTLRRYRYAPLPDYLAPLAWLGVTDDLTAVARARDDAVRYLPPASADLGFFDLANARDPRTMIVHEGVHSQQAALSYEHPDPLRRFYYDSGANEGIAFYNEELLLAAGLFDDRPDSQLAMWSFMRLRALRVEVDVRLALGEFDLTEAGRYLEEAVPMDRATAEEEAAFFAATPGQGLTYQIGKLQIQRLLSDATRVLGDDFDLRTFHDLLWRNGNVPLALLRWEYLGLRDDVDALDRLARP